MPINPDDIYASVIGAAPNPDDIYRAVAPPPPTLRPDYEGPRLQGLARDSGHDPDFSKSFLGDAAAAIGDYFTGAYKGGREQLKQERELRKIAIVDDFGNAFPRPGVSQEEVDAQQALTRRAQTNFARETFIPGAQVGGVLLAPVTGGASLYGVG